MGSKKNVSMSETEVKFKVVEAVDTAAETTEDGVAPAAEADEKTAAKEAKKAPKVAKPRSKKYQATRSQVDKTRLYDAFSAFELIKKLSYTKFAGTITAEGVIKEEGDKITVNFPHSTGKSVRVAIVDEDLLKDIEAGKIEFDVLLTTPMFMPKLAKFARTLGPKGLMPNPKNETITTDPLKKKAELEGGRTIIKAEKKAPLIHVSLGKTDTDTKALVENLEALIKAAGDKLVKLSLSATMSPGIKVDLKK